MFGSNTYGSVAGYGGNKETYITPASYTFYVWSVINVCKLLLSEPSFSGADQGTRIVLLGYVIIQFFDRRSPLFSVPCHHLIKLLFAAEGYQPIVEGVGWRFAGVALLNAVFVWFFAKGMPILSPFLRAAY